MCRHFGPGADAWTAALFATVRRAYAGWHPDFRACVLPYHNFTHASETAIAVLHLLDDHLRQKTSPTLTLRDCELAIAAVLMHDIGFLQEADDTDGTGARYARTHVRRGERFAARLLAGRGLSRAEIRLVQLAIRGTDLHACRPHVRDRRKRFLANAVTTADLAGQIAAPDFPQRLAALHTEWTDAARQNQTPPPISLRQLRLQSDAFFREHVQQRLTLPLPRDYASAIRANLRRIRRQARQRC